MDNESGQRCAARDVAAEIGDIYVSTDCSRLDAKVAAAYGHLQLQTDLLFSAAVGNRACHSIRIVFTRCRQPYGSDRELITSARACGVLEITTAAVSREPIHPLLGCEFGGAFDRFRAVHDLIGHVQTGWGFALADEFAAWRFQEGLHSGAARLALATELLAINSARSILGEAPEHKAMLLDADVVQAARARIAVSCWPAARCERDGMRALQLA